MMMHRDGEKPRHLLVDAHPLHDTGGTIIGAVACAIDVTTLREREAELRTFADVVAHDLKSPLTAVAGFCEVVADALDEQHPDLTTARRGIARIAAGAARMRTLIDDLLTYATARDGTLRSAPTDLRALVDDVINTRTDQPVAADTAAPQIYVGALPTVSVDPVLVRHLIDNLVGNAIKYTPPGQPARIDITASADGTGWARIEIADRGIGVPTGQHRAIFDNFHRAHAADGYSGTGLGLAICQRIVERHGGTIAVTDNPGGGARFDFTLPTVPPGQPHTSSRRAIPGTAT